MSIDFQKFYEHNTQNLRIKQVKYINFVQNYILKNAFFCVILQTQKGNGDSNVQVNHKRFLKENRTQFKRNNLSVANSTDVRN